jgi:hypothetical protein
MYGTCPCSKVFIFPLLNRGVRFEIVEIVQVQTYLLDHGGSVPNCWSYLLSNLYRIVSRFEKQQSQFKMIPREVS